VSGLDRVNNAGLGDPLDKNNPTNIGRGLLDDNHKYRMEAHVLLQGEQVSIKATLDGEQIVDWSGRWSELSICGSSRMRMKECFGILTGDAIVTFHKLELEMLKGRMFFRYGY